METESISVDRAGYMRRAEMDRPEYQVWETPGGEFLSFPPGPTPVIICPVAGSYPVRRSLRGV